MSLVIFCLLFSYKGHKGTWTKSRGRVEAGEGGGFSWVRVEGWGENADNCNWIKIKIKIKSLTVTWENKPSRGGITVISIEGSGVIHLRNLKSVCVKWWSDANSNKSQSKPFNTLKNWEGMFETWSNLNSSVFTHDTWTEYIAFLHSDKPVYKIRSEITF